MFLIVALLGRVRTDKTKGVVYRNKIRLKGESTFSLREVLCGVP